MACRCKFVTERLVTDLPCNTRAAAAVEKMYKGQGEMKSVDMNITKIKSLVSQRNQPIAFMRSRARLGILHLQRPCEMFAQNFRERVRETSRDGSSRSQPPAVARCPPHEASPLSFASALFALVRCFLRSHLGCEWRGLLYQHRRGR